MHFEINKGSAAVRALAKKIRAGEKTGGGKAPAPKPKPKSPPEMKNGYRLVKYGQQLQRGVYGPPVTEWQRTALGYKGAKADSFFGPGTEADTKRFQREHKLKVDGIVGPKTWAKRKA